MTQPRLTLFSDVVSASQFRIDCWKDVQEFLASLGETKGRWCFRGHHSTQWGLKTSLERVTEGHRDRAFAEQFFIRSFQRRAHHFIRTVPDVQDLLEWLALMQHWSVPTRLLDFTASVYVGLFFALNEFLNQPENVNGEPLAALWAVHHVACKGIAVVELNGARIEGLTNLSHESPLGEPEVFRRCFFGTHKLQFVAPVQPFRLNERQALQQGLFLCPSNVDLSFEENVVQPESFQEYVHTVQSSPPHDLETVVQENVRSVVRKAIISERGAREILPHLYSMNLNSATLFPDLDGYASSIVERYRALQLLPDFEKRAVGFSALNEIDSLG